MRRMAKKIQFMDSREFPRKTIKAAMILQVLSIQDERTNGIDVYGQL